MRNHLPSPWCSSAGLLSSDTVIDFVFDVYICDDVRCEVIFRYIGAEQCVYYMQLAQFHSVSLLGKRVGVGRSYDFGGLPALHIEVIG
jgi:hypothetical protein